MEQTSNQTNWIEIYKNGLINNLNQVRSKVNGKIMAVVKTNAYGHGLSVVSQIFAEQQVDYLGVTTIEEGMEIRNSGVLKTAILIFAPLLDNQIEFALKNNLDITICDINQLEVISALADKLDKKANIQIKIDTGLGRLGLYPNECMEFYSKASMLKNINITGTYTHFANAGSKSNPKTTEQINIFKKVIGELKSSGLRTGIIHASNSSGIINYPNANFDMVRPGTLLYGQHPCRYSKSMFNLQETWCFKTRIIAIRKIRANETIGYGCEYKTNKEITSAIIPVGYSNGFTMVPESIVKRRHGGLIEIFSKLKNNNDDPYVIVNKIKASVLGRVSMQMCSINISHIPGIKLGDVVVVPVRRTSASDSINRIVL